MTHDPPPTHSLPNLPAPHHPITPILAHTITTAITPPPSPPPTTSTTHHHPISPALSPPHPSAADLIHEASNAMATRQTVQDIRLNVHAHPTLSEVGEGEGGGGGLKERAA